MKTKTVIVVLILIMAVLIIAGSCATEKKAYVAKDNEELYGTWVNKDYNIGTYKAKRIFNADSTHQCYAVDDSNNVIAKGDLVISDKWSDSEGNIWYKFIFPEWTHGSITGNTLYYLAKISDSGKILETVASGIDYPTELGPDVLLYTYNINYRQ